MGSYRSTTMCQYWDNCYLLSRILTILLTCPNNDTVLCYSNDPFLTVFWSVFSRSEKILLRQKFAAIQHFKLCTCANIQTQNLLTAAVPLDRIRIKEYLVITTKLPSNFAFACSICLFHPPILRKSLCEYGLFLRTPWHYHGVSVLQG